MHPSRPPVLPRPVAAWACVALSFPAWVAGAATTQPASTRPAKGEGPGHSIHGEAFNEGPRQAAYLMDGHRARSTSPSPPPRRGAEVLRAGRRPAARLLVLRGRALLPPGGRARPRLRDGLLGHGHGQRQQREAGQGVHRRGRQAEGQGLAAARAIWIDGLHDVLPRRREGRRQARAREATSAASRRSSTSSPTTSRPRRSSRWRIWDSRHEAADRAAARRSTRCSDQVFAGRADAPGPSLPHPPVGRREARAGPRRRPRGCGQAAPAIAHMWHMPGHTYSKLQPLRRRRLAAGGVGPRRSRAHDPRPRDAGPDPQLRPQQRVAACGTWSTSAASATRSTWRRT